MLVSEDDVPDLKRWITDKLENISDADSEVLADYVLALIRAELSDTELRQSAIENLEDFLKSYTIGFVDELLHVARLKLYLPIHKDTAPTPAALPIQNGANEQQTSSRKRSYEEAVGSQQKLDPLNRATGRNTKPLISKSGRPLVPNSDILNAAHAYPEMYPISQGHVPTTFNLSSPINPLFAFQAMGKSLPQLGPNGEFAFAPFAPNSQPNKSKRKPSKRCKDYDTKGICHRGINCPYLHDANQIIIPPSGRPEHSPGLISQPGQNGPKKQTKKKRSSFSQNYPNSDTSNTTIVVEGIPDGYCNEDSVRDFFAAFGTVEEITMHESRHLALVRYDDHAAAQAAYESPKVIFENRFVKVYWLNAKAAAKLHPASDHRSNKVYSNASASKAYAITIDPEQFSRETEAAQKRWQERKALKEETEEKLADISRKTAALFEEKRALETKLRDIGAMPPQSDADKATEALRTQLRALEEEAKTLGINPEPWATISSDRSSWRGRGTLNGTRSGRQHSGKGSLRGGNNYSAYNLDNRPKKVRVSGSAFKPGYEEKLRQHLEDTIGDYASVEWKNSETESGPQGESQALLVNFNDRASAEMFFYGPRNLPVLGKVDMAWMFDAPPHTADAQRDDGASAAGSALEDVGSSEDRDEGEIVESEDEGRGIQELDYDVADDDDRWR